ncbi:MAG: undecaprenyl/decaprenyl-phosphate alpha-N-acetylglucosaminyl 1-phosphate transferase [Firmicutes bacterium]|nr:undecaprenyl/decaprenyl-phosphate alpha-N-acetylglucosaminyl 1-phosphate transferase [Bacillota bacterium]
MKEQILDASKIVLITFIFSAIIMPLMKVVANYIEAVDVPSSAEGNRHIHKKTTPKLGALGIFLSFLFGYMLFGEHSIKMNAILIGSFIVILMGIIDDIKPVKAKYRFLTHIAAASVIAFYGGITLNDITAFGFTFDFGILAYPLTILFIVACTDIIDLIDGLDGLSGGICTIFYITVAIIGFYQGRAGSLVMILTLIMLGSTLGFLLHNFYPAKIFAGDCVTFMGFIIAIITLLEFKGAALISFFVPLTILGIPILDTLFAIIRRLLKGQPPFQADSEHLHHQLLGMNFSQRTTVLIIYGINILFAAASIFYTLKDPIVGQILYIIIFIIVLWFVLHTTIISDKTPKHTKKIKEKIKKIKPKMKAKTNTKKKNNKK